MEVGGPPLVGSLQAIEVVPKRIKMSVKEEQTLALQLVRRVINEDSPPEPAHHFVFTRVGNEVLLETGFFNLVELKEAIDSSIAGTPGKATLTIRHRLLLTPQVLEQLFTATSQILSGFKETEKG